MSSVLTVRASLSGGSGSAADAVLSCFNSVRAEIQHLHHVLFVVLYLPSMRHFGDANQGYKMAKDLLAAQGPPSRACLQLRSPSDHDSSLPPEEWVRTQAYAFMCCLFSSFSLFSNYYCYCYHFQKKKTLKKDAVQADEVVLEVVAMPLPAGWTRRGLHVQSISHWAPACIGPYAQATLIDIKSGVQGRPRGFAFVAGQVIRKNEQHCSKDIRIHHRDKVVVNVLVESI